MQVGDAANGRPQQCSISTGSGSDLSFPARRHWQPSKGATVALQKNSYRSTRESANRRDIRITAAPVKRTSRSANKRRIGNLPIIEIEHRVPIASVVPPSPLRRLRWVVESGKVKGYGHWYRALDKAVTLGMVFRQWYADFA